MHSPIVRQIDFFRNILSSTTCPLLCEQFYCLTLHTQCIRIQAGHCYVCHRTHVTLVGLICRKFGIQTTSCPVLVRCNYYSKCRQTVIDLRIRYVLETLGYIEIISVYIVIAVKDIQHIARLTCSIMFRIICQYFR